MKLSNWITTVNPPTNVQYDVRNPPTSNIIASSVYSGPRLDVCGEPRFTLKSAGQEITFLSHSFDSVSK